MNSLTGVAMSPTGWMLVVAGALWGAILAWSYVIYLVFHFALGAM